MYYNIGEYSNAEYLAEPSDYFNSLHNLAAVYIATGRQAHAMKQMKNAAAVDNQMIDQIYSIGSESQRMIFFLSIG